MIDIPKLRKQLEETKDCSLVAWSIWSDPEVEAAGLRELAHVYGYGHPTKEQVSWLLDLLQAYRDKEKSND